MRKIFVSKFGCEPEDLPNDQLDSAFEFVEGFMSPECLSADGEFTQTEQQDRWNSLWQIWTVLEDKAGVSREPSY